ncbi:OmpA family protein [Myceligenerans pegani]|uniref:OmpA family protein n=1 Tax=Myceligenerans pegani TaxID=2776917 RepID=A0ABR9N2C4_9MICO|nr:OmpA family protein [Myceligenerans sp. TRM 65318]MBE1877783.1 OmpA family protein [Myceligenerans sp. TRM 65318]MBE3020054.1 OmpA family protein [Myceligenerans sp. TRM 65318]
MSTLKALLGPIVVAVLALAGLSSWQDTGFREQIEDKLTASSQEALSAAGVAGADVSFVGRDATVEAGTTTAAAAAGAVVRDVTGVRVVRAVGPDGEVDLDAVASGEADDDGTAGEVTADDSDSGSGDSADDGAVDGTDDADAGSDDIGSDADDAGSDDSESEDDGSGSGSSDSEDGDGGSGDDDSAESDSDDADREPTKKERAEAQDDLVEIPNITFVTDSARLTRDGKKVVRQAARVLEEHPDVRVRIEGHTDSRGDEDDNQRLSERRARTVLDRLVDLGVDEDRLSYKGFGESRPRVAPLTFADLEKNRRVEFVVRD